MDTLASNVIVKIASPQQQKRPIPSLSPSPRLPDSFIALWRFTEESAVLFVMEISPHRSTYAPQSLWQMDKHITSLLTLNIKRCLQSGWNQKTDNGCFSIICWKRCTQWCGQHLIEHAHARAQTTQRSSCLCKWFILNATLIDF